MKKFFLNLLFLLPLVIYYAVPLYICFASGEFSDTSEILKTHLKKNSIVDVSFNQNFIRALTLQYIKVTPKKKVLVIGASRVLQFRSLFFKDNDFLTCGRITESVRDNLTFLQQIPKDKLPDVIIIGFEHYHFRPRYNVCEEHYSNDFTYNPSIGVLLDYKTVNTVWGKIYKGDIGFSTLQSADSLNGLVARLYHQGYRTDGSYRYGFLIQHPESNYDLNFKSTLDRIKTGYDLFEYADNLCDKSLNDADSLLAFLKENHIRVISFLPPFAPSVYNELLKHGKDYGYVQKLGPALAAISKKYGFEFYDYSDSRHIGNPPDDEFLDGYHGSDITYARIVKGFYDSGTVLKGYVDTNSLDNFLRNKKTWKNFYD